MGALSSQDKDRLCKLLALTNSEHDGEALAALRKANGLLARLRLHWVEVFADDCTSLSQHQRIEAAFDLCFAGATGQFREFLESLRIYWKTKGSLTSKQQQALFAAEARQRQWMAAAAEAQDG